MKKSTLIVLLVLFIKIAIGQVTVTITVKNNLSPSMPVSGASVTLTGATTPTVISDASGNATFSVPTPTANAFYPLAVTAPGYLDYSSTSLVFIRTTDVTITKTATIKKAFDIVYKVTDKNSLAIAGASVKINTAPATTRSTDANGEVTFSGLYSVGTHSTLVSAAGYADSTFNVSVLSNSANPFTVPAVKLRNAYNITFTVTDGANPVAEAKVTIGNNSVTTDASGVAVFAKNVNGNYAYSITKSGYIDKTGFVTVSDGDQTPAVTLLSGYDLTFTIINGASGTVGLQKDTITIDGITKITDATGVLTFGVAAGSSYSFVNKKAGFISVPVEITNVSAHTALTINMVPVYTVKFTVSDSYDGTKVAGAKVTLNGSEQLTDASGVAKFIDVAASATALSYTISGPDGSNYIAQSGTVSAPLVSTNYLSTNNNISKTIYYEKPSVFIGLTSGLMSYFGVATITFNGVDYNYDAGMGGNTFFVSPGTYNYTVTPADVTKAIVSGTVAVTATAGARVMVSVVSGKKIEFFVIDETPEQNTIEGASVSLDGVTKITDAAGYVAFERKAINSTFTYSISKAGYGPLSGTADLVTADLLLTRVLQTAHKVTFTVYNSDGWPMVPLEGASVTFGSNTAVTDANGIALLPDAVNGSYDYSVSKTGFVTVTGNASVTDADLMMEVYMKPAFSVQFTVTDGTNPVANASVRLVSGWPVFDQTFVTNAEGVLLTDKLFPKWTSLDYTISADGFADAKGTANIQNVDLVVDPIALQHAYEITFTVTDGSNPVADAAVTINNVVVTTNAGGNAVFQKMINGDYNFMVSKPGFIDIAGTVTVDNANAAKTVSLAAGFDVTFNVINGPEGNVGLANDTITLNGITKVTGASGTVVFGVASGTAISFTNKKAGFAEAQVDIAAVTENTVKNIYMVPVYNINIRALDGNSYNPIAGATVLFNGTSVNTDADGVAAFTNIQPAATAYAYTVTGNGTYNSVSGEIMLPFTSTEEYLSANNVISKTEFLSSPSVYIGLVRGMMTYFGAATIALDGVEQDYNAGMGGNSFNCALGTHTYVVTPADETRAILRGTVEVTAENSNVYLSLNVVAGYTADIYTIDQSTEPIEGASVTFGGTTLLTDATGLASFTRYPAGNYTVSASKDNYSGITAEVVGISNADVLKLLTLNQLTFTVTFNVTSGTEHLEGATVTLNGVSATTDASGTAHFSGIAPGTYSYTVSKEIYKTVEGSITVDKSDITEDVNLLNTTGLALNAAKTIKMYPNPTNGILHLNLGETGSKQVTVQITNIIGKVLYENKLVNNPGETELDLSGFNNGVYFVKVIGDGFENSVKVVKN